MFAACVGACKSPRRPPQYWCSWRLVGNRKLQADALAGCNTSHLLWLLWLVQRDELDATSRLHRDISPHRRDKGDAPKWLARPNCMDGAQQGRRAHKGSFTTALVERAPHALNGPHCRNDELKR